MKILCEDKVYVQKDDIYFLINSDIPIPVSIYSKLFDNELVVFDKKIKNKFIEFNNNGEIEFFKDLKWLLDYNELKDLTIPELAKKAEEVVKKHNKLAKRYNAMSVNKKMRNSDILRRIDLLDYKIEEYKTLILFKDNKIKLELPDDVEYPKEYKNKFNTKKLLKSLLKKPKK